VSPSHSPPPKLNKLCRIIPGAVVWGMDTSNVDTVFVAGRALKRNGVLLNVDLNRIRKMAYESRNYVVAQSGFKLPQI
jgi:hypothetical protein